MKLPALLLFLALTCDTFLHAERPVWQPDKTWVFAVGVLNFDNPDTTTYPDEGRMDAVMIDTLKKRGVPSDHIVFIKNEQATRDNVTHKLDAFLKRPGAEDTLIFYYAGHGGRDYTRPERTCTFLTYDTKSSWTVASVFNSVEKNFHGQQVIYTADCCHSGSLVEEAKHHAGSTATLSSAHVASTSTGRWTFTRCLVQMFSGDPLLDDDGDGSITFSEAAHHNVDEMAFVEGQHSASGTNGGFRPDTVMAAAAGPHTSRMGDLIEGESRGKWWKAEIIGEKEGKVLVTWPGWAKSYDEWLPMNRTRPYHPKTFAPGTAVQTEWRKQWYDAKVIKAELGLHLVHYEGFPDTDDEWVVLERLKER